MTASPMLLQVVDLHVVHGGVRALDGVSLDLRQGGAMAVLGANGAGKSSLAAAVAGVLTPEEGRILFDGHDVTDWPPHRRSRAGMAYVPEGRGIFPHLTVVENLRMSLRHAVARPDRGSVVERALHSFPVLAERRHQPAGTLSGGEQQMLSLARVLAVPPRLLVADEMSLGLAPFLIDVVFTSLHRARAQGVAVLLIEQYADRALELVDEALLLRQGVVTWRGPSSEAGAEVVAGYLGDQPGSG